MTTQCQIPVATLAQAFRIGAFRFTLVPLESLFVPAVNKANMLRGAFGTAFRRLCCIPQCRNARECPLASACPYKAIFEPSPPPDADRLRGNQDIPRPFLFRAPASNQTKFQPGEEFQFGLVLIGRAVDHLPYFVLSFRELAAHGLGLNRAKCELRSVKEDTIEDLLKADVPVSQGNTDGASASAETTRTTEHQIYDSASQVFHAPQGLDLERWINRRVEQISLKQSNPNASQSMMLKVRFLTPTLLKAENSVKRSPEFHYLLKRLRDRINALSTFFGSGPLQADFAGMGERAEQVRTVSCNVEWEDRFRISSKTRQRHELSGFAGETVYEGNLQEFLPWLVMGELVHAGKHAAWGMGRVVFSAADLR